MSYVNRKFSWDLNKLREFYQNYVIKWLNAAMSWTESQKKQARANLGMGNGDLAEGSDFVNPDATKRAKVPTVGAVLDAVATKIGYYLCDTAASTAAKTVSADGYVLTTGGSIKIKMTNANTADNATLNIQSTGAKPLFYDGQRASSSNTWEAGETIEVYYDGTNFMANNVAGGGGVIDVSEKYPTSGVEGGNTYTLEGALTVLNTNLPASKKKGGMSIKFKSSDNKYVQYRLMADEWSTTVSDWQSENVDDEPTAGSVNLAESGGINKFVAEVNSIGKKELGLISFYGYAIKNGYLLKSDGTIEVKTSSKYRTIYTNTPVSKNSILVFTGTCNTSDKIFSIGISSVPITDENITSVQITLLSNKTYPVGDISETMVVPFDGYIVYYRYTDYWTNVNARIKNVPILSDNSVLDVSEFNNTNYNSLSEAIAAIPETLQKGGMEIRFKQLTLATYTVVKTEGVETQPTGTELQEALTLESGTYTAAHMTGVEPPESGSVTYYLAVTETVDGQEVTTYTTWVITKVTSDYNKYVQYRYTAESIDSADFTNETNWELNVTKKNLSEDFLGLLSEIKDFTIKNCSILETGKFGSANYKHAVLSVNEGEVYYLIGQTSNCRAAFVTTDESSSGEDVPVVPGTGIMPMSSSKQYYKFIIPQGCTHLIFNASGNYGTRCYKHYDSLDVSEAYINDYKEVEVIDLATIDSYVQRRGSFSSGSWKNTSITHHLMFDVFGDDCMIKVTANNNNNALIAFVDDISCPMENYTVPFVEGTSSISIAAGETKYIIVPKGTVALLVHLGNPETNNYKPDALTIYRNRNTKSVDGIVVNASYMTCSSTGVIQANTRFNGKALKVRAGDVFHISDSSENTRTIVSGFIDTLPVIGSVVTVEHKGDIMGLYKQYVADRDGWFIIFRNGTDNFSVNYYSRAMDAAVKRDEASFDKYLKTLIYNEVDFSNIQLYKAAYLSYGIFGNTDYRSVFVDVRKASFVKIVPNNNYDARIGWLTEIGEPASGVVPSYVASHPGAIAISSAKVLEVPNGASYMVVYLGAPDTYNYKPTYMGIYGEAQSGGSFSSYEQLVVDFNARRDRNLTEHSNIGITPRIIPVDDNGWEIPESLQQINAQKKSEQLVNIRWTPKWDVPAQSGNNYIANTVVTTGIPYSSNNDDGSKIIGEETSLHTFMTAVDNPYSLLYTECVNNEARVPSTSKPNAPRQASYWGKIYTLSNNGFAYYGTVCCGLTSSVENSPLKWNNGVIRDYIRSNGIYIPVCAPGVVDFNLIKIGDVCDNKAHSFLIYGLHRDSNGEIDQVKYVESTTGYRNGGCRIVTKTKQEFAEHVNRAGDPFTVFRYVKLWANTDYESSEYVPLTARGETETAVTYNNAICTFAGDKCTFRGGDLIVINYNLYGTQAHDWTKIQVYKNEVLLREYTLAEAEQTLVNYLSDNGVTPNPFNPAIDEHNHALVLGTELTEGMYKACMIDANDNASDYTYWEILDNTVTAVKLGEDEYEITVGGTRLIQVIYVNLVNMYYLPSYEEQQERKFIVRPAALAKLFGNTDTGYNVSVKLAGVYGNVTTVPVTLHDGDITPNVEPDDDNA